MGSDFDGIEEVPMEMQNAGELGNLAEIMAREGLIYHQIEKIFYGNVKRFLEENL